MRQVLSIIVAGTENVTYLRETAEAATRAASVLRVEVELIVAVQSSHEEVARRALAGLPCRLLSCAAEHVAAWNNAGAAAASGEMIFFLQEGIILTADGLNVLLENLLLDAEIAAVGPFSNRTLYAWQYMNAEAMAAKGEDSAAWVRQHLTGAAESLFIEDFALLMRRRAFDRVGGFDEDFTGGGADLDLSFRLKYEGFHILRAPAYLAHRGAEVCELYDLRRPAARPLLAERWGLDIGVPETIWQDALGNISWAHDLPLIRATGRTALLSAPLVSILVPVSGSSAYLAETLESALAQTYPNIEIVIACDDRTRAQVTPYLGDLRVRCVRCTGERDPSLRTCLHFAQGAYVQYCAVGDVLLPDRLTQMMDVFFSRPKTAFVTAMRGVLDETGAFAGMSEEVAPLEGFWGALDGRAVGRELLLRQINPLGTLACALLRRSDLAAWLDERRDEEWVDAQLWLRLLAGSDVTIISRPMGLTHASTADAERCVRTALSWRREIEEHWQRRVFLTNEEDYRAARASLQDMCNAQIAPLLPAVSPALRMEYETGHRALHVVLLNRVEECTPIRLDAPLARLAARGQVTLSGALHGGDPSIELYSLGELYDSFILLERCNLKCEFSVNALLQRYGTAGNIFVQEMDDHPMISENAAETDYFLFRAVSAVQTSTPYLADLLRQFNPYVYLFENQLTELPEARTYDVERACVTVFFGALNRRADWEPLMPALNAAIRRHGDRLYFRVVSDREFFDALQTNAKEFAGGERDGDIFAPYEQYTAALHASDIALLPLRDTEFNRAKSDLKFIESAGHGAVALASPTVYAATVRDGETGLIYHSPEEFAEKLDLLIARADLRRTLAENAYRYVAAHRLLDQHLGDYIAAYREMFARREEFERERRARVEKFFPQL